MTLNQLFDLSLDLRRDETALEWQGHSFTFGDIGVRALRTANVLRARGLRAGDRLCVQLANSIELIDLYLACVRLGVIFVPINVLYREREVAHILADAAPGLFITRENLTEVMSEAGKANTDCPVSRSPRRLARRARLHFGHHRHFEGRHPDPQQLRRQRDQPARLLADYAADRFLLALPLFHVHALGNGLHCWLLSGCRMRLLERFEHQQAVTQFLNFRPTLFSVCPPSIRACSILRPRQLARSDNTCVSSCRGLRLCPRGCSKIFATCSAIPFWSGTA